MSPFASYLLLLGLVLFAWVLSHWRDWPERTIEEPWRVNPERENLKAASMASLYQRPIVVQQAEPGETIRVDRVGVDGAVSLRISKDGGVTWGEERRQSVKASPQRGNRT